MGARKLAFACRVLCASDLFYRIEPTMNPTLGTLELAALIVLSRVREPHGDVSAHGFHRPSVCVPIPRHNQFIVER